MRRERPQAVEHQSEAGLEDVIGSGGRLDSTCSTDRLGKRRARRIAIGHVQNERGQDWIEASRSERRPHCLEIGFCRRTRSG